MTKIEREPSELAAKIAADIADCAPFRTFAEEIGTDFEQAYRLQDRVVQALLARSVANSICGYKIALNVKSAMARYGISEPLSGRLFSTQRHRSPASLQAKDYRSFLIEPEIAAILKLPLSPIGGGHTRQSVSAAIERLIPAFELIDTRGAHIPDLSLPTAIAQNITNVGIVIGGPGCAPSALDVETLLTVVTVNDEFIAERTAAAPQHPLDAVAWLANHLHARGLSLDAGMVVLCGTHMPAMPVSSPATARVQMGALGEASFSIA